MKNLTLLLIVFCASSQLFAQHEIGISLGTSHLLGDFGGGPGNGTVFIKDLDVKATRPSVGLFYRYNFFKFFGVRAQFLHASLYSNDLFSEESNRFSRGLSSKATINDGSIQLEFNFVSLIFCSGKANFSPYVAGGLGLSSINSKIASSNSEGISNAETQYIQNGKALALNLPITFGVKYKTKENIVIAIEASYRIAFTDKIDAYVRQQNDHFIFVSANVSYVFCKGNRSYANKTKCPTFD